MICSAIIHGQHTLVSRSTRHYIVDCPTLGSDHDGIHARGITAISLLTARSLHILLSQPSLLADYYFVTAIKYLAKYGTQSLSLSSIIFKAASVSVAISPFDASRSMPIHRRVALLLSACKHSNPISMTITTNARLNTYLSSGSMKFSFEAKDGYALIAPGNRGRLTRRVIRRNLSIPKIISLILPELDDEMVNIIECLLYRL